MKKVRLLAMIVLVFALFCTGAQAATTCRLYVDDVEIGTSTENEWGEPLVYTDVLPEVKSGVSYVPLRFVGELFGAEVNYLDGKVSLTLDDVAIELVIGQKVATVGDEAVALLGATYTKEGRTMVPLRFISEAFGCKVNYANSKIWIKTEPLVIDGQEIAALQSQAYMTMGGWVNEFTGNLFVKHYYDELVGSLGDEVDEPSNGRLMMLDAENYYYLEYREHFTFSTGVEDNAVRTLTLYGLIENMNVSPDKKLVHDEQANKWYEVDVEKWDAAAKWKVTMGGKEILNNVA